MLGGIERGLKFNNKGLEVVVLKADGTNTGFMYAMIYGGLIGNSYAKEQEPDYTFEQVIDWIDEIDPKIKVQLIEDVTKCMTSTQGYKTLVKAGESIEVEAIVKKKAPKKSVTKRSNSR